MTRPTPVPNDAGGDVADTRSGSDADGGEQVMTAQLSADSGEALETGVLAEPRGAVEPSDTLEPAGAVEPAGAAERGGTMEPDRAQSCGAGVSCNAARPGSATEPGVEKPVTEGTAHLARATRADTGTAESESAIQTVWKEFARAPSRRVRDRLVLHYAPLVKYVAGRVGTGLPTHVDVADLIQSGIFGLVDAIEKFDQDRGLRFETYAMQRIRGAILDDLRSQDWVPRMVRSRAREVERANDRLGARLHRTPTDAEVAAELGITVRELRELYGQLRLTSVIALDKLVGAGTENTAASPAETLPDEDAIDPAAVLIDRDNRRQLAEAIAQLSERDRIVVSLYYFESLTLAEIGKVLGVTESRVSQLHTRAVLRLRAKLVEQSHF